ncbi:AMP-binding protein [Saccharothrix sp. NRRL B-16314]|uniref:AMP-binding protein n=1 Tax=Saccharothrix sp. NRRL B-16314 TaxID=1463825 RepID=UPI000A93963D|nr:AMP-binding protein [Saccharothrix sp. NRRL B-16314]
MLGLSALSFDLSVWDVFGALGAGATLVLPGDGDRRDPGRWLELVRDNEVTIWNSVPALATMFADHVLGVPGAAALPVRLAMLSGDWIPLELPEKLRAIAPDMRVMSLGGATEAAIWSIAYDVGEVEDGWDSIPYGTPMRNQTFHVLDESLDECAVHVTGELYIGGVGLAEGYLGDPEKTAERFVRHPRSGQRLYRTGDLGRWRPEGFIEFLGREDNQVKVGGYRIELGEIEAAMVRHPAVVAAVAAAPGDRHHRRLIGYVVPAADAPDGDRLVEAVTAHLRAELPAYLVPPTLVVLDRLPLTANGKVDRSALPDPAAVATSVAQEDDQAVSAAADLLGRIVRETLGLESVDVGRGFLEVGGDSVRAVQIATRARAEGLAIGLQDLFEQPTLRAAAALAGPRPTGGPATGVPIPLTPHQRTADRAARVRVPVDRSVTAEEVTAAATALLAATPALRLRREEDVQVVTDPEPAYVPVVDLSALPEDRRDRVLTAMLAEMAEELDPAGTVARAAIFDLGAEQAVYWLVHDFAADTASLPLLAERTASLLAGGPPPAPGDAAVEWLRAVDDPSSAPPPPPAEPGELGAARLDETETERLAGVCADAYRMTLAEACFAALVLVLPEPTACQVRVDGRGALPDVDATGHVGQFTLTGSLVAPAGGVPGPDLLLHAKSALRGLGQDTDHAAVGFHFAGVAPLPEEAAGPVLTAAVVDGALSLAWNGPLGGRDATTLAEATAHALRAIADHCAEDGTGVADAADFPLAGLSDGELATVLAGLSDGVR